MKYSSYKILLSLFLLNLNLISFAYVPPIININTFSNPKEVHLSFGFGTNGPEQSLSVSIDETLYAFINNNFSIDTMLIHDFRSKHHFIEGGFGSSQKLNKYWRLIATGGYAYGQFYSKRNKISNYDYFFSTNKHDGINYIAHRFFVSLNYGLEFKYIEFYFGGKLTIGDYISTNTAKTKHLYASPTLEPNLTVKFGMEKLKIIAQVRKSIDTFNLYSTLFASSRNNPLEYSFVSFGIELNINKQIENKQ